MPPPARRPPRWRASADARAAAERSGEIRYLAELHRLEGALHAAGDDRAPPSAASAMPWRSRASRGSALGVARRHELGAPGADAGRAAPVRRAERETLAALVATFSEGVDTRDLTTPALFDQL